MKKMSSRTSVRYTSALASKRPGARTCHPSSYVVATTGFKAGSGPRGERQRASGLWVGARQLDDGGRAEPTAHGREHLVSAPAVPGEPDARGEPPEDVQAVLRRVDQVLERH